MSRYFHVAMLAFSSLAVAAIICAQTGSPEEVTGSSRPYAPPAAPPPSSGTINVKTQVVAVGVVVRDTKGNIVTNLKQSDFQVFDNGKPQAVSAFSIESIAPQNNSAAAPDSSGENATPAATSPSAPLSKTMPPRFIALYFDDVHTDSGDLDRAKASAKGLVQNGVEPGDKLAIFTGSSTVAVDFTSDAPKVLAAIDQLNPHPRMGANGLPGCPPITPYEAYLVNNHLDLVIQDRLIEDAKRCMCDIDISDASCVAHAREVVATKSEQTWDLAEQISELTLETLRGVVTYLAKMPGERVLVVASSGFLNGGLELGYKQDLIINNALRSGIIINSIDLKGLATGGPGGTVAGLKEINKDTSGMNPYELMYDSVIFGQKLSSLNSSMWELADATGGTFFHNNNDLGKGFHRLTDAPAIEYQLAYSPENLKEDGKFHKIQVKLAASHSYLVQARTGYFAPTKALKKVAPATAPASAPAPAPPALSAVDREVLATDDLSDLAVTVDVKPGKNDKGEPTLLATVHINVKLLSFDHKDDRSIEKLTFVLALFDEKGNFASGQQGEMNLALKSSTLDRFDREGLSAKMWLQAPPGNYRLRAVAQDSVNNKLFASTQPVEIK